MNRSDDLLSHDLSKPEMRRLYLQERLIFDVAECICAAMDEDNVSRSELAERIGRTKGYVTQVLRGSANLTLRTVADIFGALGRSLDVMQK